MGSSILHRPAYQIDDPFNSGQHLTPAVPANAVGKLKIQNGRLVFRYPASAKVPRQTLICSTVRSDDMVETVLGHESDPQQLAAAVTVDPEQPLDRALLATPTVAIWRRPSSSLRCEPVSIHIVRHVYLLLVAARTRVRMASRTGSGRPRSCPHEASSAVGNSSAPDFAPSSSEISGFPGTIEADSNPSSTIRLDFGRTCSC